MIAFCKIKKNSMASVRKRTIPTERPPLVSEVSANFLRIEGRAALRLNRGNVFLKKKFYFP
jgi:hypothetical protein